MMKTEHEEHPAHDRALAKKSRKSRKSARMQGRVRLPPSPLTGLARSEAQRLWRNELTLHNSPHLLRCSSSFSVAVEGANHTSAYPLLSFATPLSWEVVASLETSRSRHDECFRLLPSFPALSAEVARTSNLPEVNSWHYVLERSPTTILLSAVKLDVRTIAGLRSFSTYPILKIAIPKANLDESIVSCFAIAFSAES